MAPAAAIAVAAADRRSLDPHVWKACAGASATIPAVGSRVYYFPQGHVEQASSPPDLSAAPCRTPYALCVITSVSFLADLDSDEVFARISLDPRISPLSFPPFPHPPPAAEADAGGVAAFAKILTPSDANNGGGFSVPRFCADSIFPPLNFAADPPAQNIFIRDMHGKVWEFRHIYRGTPRRHLLTTGWSKFVNSKNLIAGDTVVFMRDRSDELFVGVRRSVRYCVTADYSHYAPPEAGAGARSEKYSGNGEGFSRNGRGRVPAGSVVEAIRLMEMNQPFVVSSYPRAGSPEFVVAEEAVAAAMRVQWRPGMRVRMPVETEDSRTTWFQGTVTSSAVHDVGPWPRSPWRMLQVNWDDPEVLQNVRSASPWQVDLVSATTHIQTPYPTTKKLRVLLSPELLSDREGSMFFPLTGSDGTKMGSLSPSVYNYNTFPAGMQGARHDICVSSLYNFVPRNTHHMFSNDLCGINMQHKLENVSTKLSIGSASQSQVSSPPSQESIHDNGTELLSAAACCPTKKASESSFQLFGQIIHMKQPIDDDVDTNYGKIKGEAQSVDFSLSYPHKQLHNSLNVQH